MHVCTCDVGVGFKLAPVVGEVLADLATGKTPKYDMTHFKLGNFTKHTPCKL